MKLYVCYGTFAGPDRHPCAKAHRALRNAGHSADVIRTYGCFGTDPIWPGRRTVKHLTGTYKVPTLVLDDGTVIDGSDNISAWAKSNQASAVPAKR